MTASEAALARSRTALACSYTGQGRAATPTPAGFPPCGAAPTDLGQEIAAATLDAARRSVDARGLAFEVSDPEPVLRGLLGAYAAIARTLPGGLDEAWALLGLLALELDDAGRQHRPTSGLEGAPALPWPEQHGAREAEQKPDRAETAADGRPWTLCPSRPRRPRKAAVPSTARSTMAAGGIPFTRRIALAERHIAETEAHIVHHATLIGHLAADGRDTSLADTLLWLTGQTLDALHAHRRAILSEAEAAETAAPP